MRRIVVAVLLATAACATVAEVPLDQQMAPLALAFSEPVESLEARAAAREPEARYALSFLHRHGLRGVPQDRERAESLRAGLGPSSFTTYVHQPAVNGAPAYSIPIRSQVPGLPLLSLDACGEAVLEGPSGLGELMCGSAERYDALVEAAKAALGDRFEEHRVRALVGMDPAEVTSCVGRRPLVRAMAVALRDEDAARLNRLGDRVLALCGEGEASFDARILMANAALSAGDLDRVEALTRPLPALSDGRIGAYGSYFEMAVAEGRRDWPRFAAVRDRLLAASAAKLEADGAVVRMLETEPARIRHAEVDYAADLSRRATLILLAQPRSPQEPARTYYLLQEQGMEGGGTYVLETFTCRSRRALEASWSGRPGLDAVLAAVEADLLALASGAVQDPPLAQEAEPNPCSWQSAVFPRVGRAFTN